MLEKGAVSANLACSPGDHKAKISPYHITDTGQLDAEVNDGNRTQGRGIRRGGNV